MGDVTHIQTRQIIILPHDLEVTYLIPPLQQNLFFRFTILKVKLISVRTYWYTHKKLVLPFQLFIYLISSPAIFFLIKKICLKKLKEKQGRGAGIKNKTEQYI